jgi:hypothetical protein
MDVIGLDRILDDPELGARSGGEGAAHGRERPAGAEAAEGRHGPERHVDGVDGDMRRTGTVGDTGPASRGRRPSCAGPAAAPGAGRGEAELGGSAGHLD